MLKISLLALAVVLFNGCGLNKETLPLSKYHKYEVLYEVTYDLECKIDNGARTWSMMFKKGDIFGPELVEGEIVRTTGIQGNGEPIILPKSTIRLYTHHDPSADWSALIYPDGSFVSEYQFAYFTDGGFSVLNQNNCELIDGKPLFKQVKNPR